MIDLSAMVSKLNLISVSNIHIQREITGGYVSDLLSDVMANAKDGNIWVTNQKHQNCIAVASLLGIAAIIIAGGVAPDDNTVEKAVEEKVPLYTTQLSAFEAVGRLYEMGIRG